MRILFVIKATGRGLGGHYRSLDTISSEVGKHADVDILVFGRERPVALSETKYLFILFSKNLIRTLVRYHKILREGQYNVVHTFDTSSLVLTKLLRKSNILHNKCGGPNIKRYPYVSHLVCFSKENYDYYKTHKYYKKARISLIPNRVNPFLCNTHLIDDLRKDYNITTTDFIILKIGRIHKDYKKTILQGMMLKRKLQIENPNLHIKLLILGSVQNHQIIENLKSWPEFDNNIIFIGADKYISNAKLIIDIANCIIGTGRGFMEGCYRGKILFAPIRHSELPILVTRENFRYFLYYNFSERTLVPKESIEISINSIDQMASSKRYNVFTQEVYKTYFDIESRVEDYLHLYNRISKDRICIKRWDKNTIYHLSLLIFDALRGE